MAVTKEILSLAVETGDALLRNGAEVYRVEDTVMHILEAYEIEEYDVYVLSNGIFASANENKEDACSMIRHVPRIWYLTFYWKVYNFLHMTDCFLSKNMLFFHECS